MSAQAVAVVRGIYENYGSGDYPAVLAALDPDIEWIENDQEYLPHRGTHRGPDEVVAKVFGMVESNFDQFTLLPATFHDAGDVVVVEGRVKGKTKAGHDLDARAVWVWTVRQGRAVRNVNYHDTDAFRVALAP